MQAMTRLLITWVAYGVLLAVQEALTDAERGVLDQWQHRPRGVPCDRWCPLLVHHLLQTPVGEDPRREGDSAQRLGVPAA